jgi:polar amino acid transport system substrate-binding protein
MKLILKTILLLLISMLSLFSIASKAVENIDDIVWITEDAPIQNYFNNKHKLVGSSIKIVKSILKTTGSKQTIDDIKVLPWALAYQKTLNNKNYALFSTSRTEEREKLFKWAGPISALRIAIVSKKDSGIRIKDLQEVRKYKIGVVNHDVGQQLINSMVKDLKVEFADSTKGNLQQLNAGTVDLIVGNEAIIKYFIKNNGLNIQDYKTVYILKELNQWVAFNVLTSDELVQTIQSAFDKK